jgi:hypothetical protein
MTTKNRIITEVIDDALYIPIESVHSNDSITYVYKDSRKHQIIPGKSNENDIIVLKGLEKDDKIYLEPPAQADNWSVQYLDGDLEMDNTYESDQKTLLEVDGGVYAYYLVAGSFSEIKDAKLFLNQLKSDGFSNGGIISSNKLNRVYLDKFDSQEAAEIAKIKLPEKYTESWVLKEAVIEVDDAANQEKDDDRKRKEGGKRKTIN